jgi:hypothetical protein
VVFVLAAALPAAAGEALYWEERNGKVVFTNAPSSAASRVVPGFAATDTGSAAHDDRHDDRNSGDLPATIYDAFIERLAREYRVSAQLIKAVAHVESAFDPHAVSRKGAMGLMQLMPATAKDQGVKDAFDPLENLRGGARYLSALLRRYDEDLDLALAAYNAGPEAVRRHGGVPGYPETERYIRKVRQRLGQGAPEPRRARSAGHDGDRSGHASAPAPATAVSGRGVEMVRHPDGRIELVN